LNLLGHIPSFFNDLTPCENMAEAIGVLRRLYNGAVEDLNAAFDVYSKTGDVAKAPAPTYPYLLLRIGKRHAGRLNIMSAHPIRKFR